MTSDMSGVIVPRSDQINADDLIAGPMTITVREVQIRGGQDQPVSIYFEGSDKAFRPCKSMSRVLVQGWGPDAKAYAGRSLTLYRDPTVKWAGLEVGGIRISHMSHIDSEKLMMLTEKKGSRKPHKVMPLKVEPQRDKAAEWATSQIAAIEAAEDADSLAQVEQKGAKAMGKLQADRHDLHKQIADAIEAKRATLADELPAWRAKHDEILSAIEAAEDKDALAAVDAELVKHRVAFPDDVADALDAGLSEKRRALETEQRTAPA